ncbi:MAG: hypothetical protein JRN43_03555 [Nitrososphaerota archaeon]|jgi:predicted nucleic acid-binding protein|nr:hypothetical protein [Nitrososphaerota archaeon]MDG7019374.1 hypothetical protein [Nitrososphaerota archaeon]
MYCHRISKYGWKLSFADAVSARLMQDSKVHEIASFDSEATGSKAWRGYPGRSLKYTP